MFVVALFASLACATPPEEPPADLPVVEEPVAVELPAPVVPAGPPVFRMNDTVSTPTATNDVFGMAGEIELGGPVGDNAYIMGGEARIGEPVHGDLFVMGGSVRIDAPVDGDVYAMGGEVELTPQATVGGHLSVGGGEVQMNGVVAGDATLGAGSLTLGGSVGGDVSVEAGELILGDGATIGGDLEYSAPTQVSGVDQIVAGAVSWTEVEADEWQDDEPSMLGAFATWALFTGWSYGSKLVTGVALMLLFGAGGVSRMLQDKPAQSLGYGVAGFVILPIVSLLAMVLVLPLPLGVLGFIVFGLSLFLCQLFAAQALGERILTKLRPGRTGAPALALAVGLVPLVFFSSLPWVGFLVWYIATVMGAGALWMRLRENAAA